jgi:hypothetical protein
MEFWIGLGPHLIGIVPLACLAWLHYAGHRRSVEWWLMGAAFGVSFLADFAPWRLAQQTYPISQAALFALVLLPSRKALELFVAVLLAAAAISILARDAAGVDVLLRCIAWGSISALAWTMLAKGALRTCLTLGFGALTVAWLAYLLVPGWWTWGAYQGVRLGVAVWWCYAAWRHRDG